MSPRAGREGWTFREVATVAWVTTLGPPAMARIDYRLQEQPEGSLKVSDYAQTAYRLDSDRCGTNRPTTAIVQLAAASKARRSADRPCPPRRGQSPRNDTSPGPSVPGGAGAPTLVLLYPRHPTEGRTGDWKAATLHHPS